MNGRNKEFVKNGVYRFAQNWAINNFGDNPIYGKKGILNGTQKSMAIEIYAYLNEQKRVQMDFVKDGSNHVFARPVVKDNLDFLGIKYKKEIKKLLRNPKTVIIGYWSPYISYGSVNAQIESIDEIGYVDVPINPGINDYKYVFTGAMHGCWLVVASIPTDSNKMRVYHYQSADSNSKFNYKKGGSFLNGIWYLTFADYGEEGADTSCTGGVTYNGFNFLYYSNGNWYCVCQPQTMEVSNQGQNFTAKKRQDKPTLNIQLTKNNKIVKRKIN